MYTYEYLSKNEYFKNKDFNYILDSLTKTISREYIIGLINDLIKNNKPFYLCMIDIDNFKLVNDSFGHQVGDIVLEEASKDIISVIGDKGYVGRYGGDEFIVVITDINSMSYDATWKILKEYFDSYLRDKSYKEINDSNLTVTVGAVNYPKDASNFEELLLKADKALYRGKQKGRNCFIIYDEKKHSKIDATFLHNDILITGLMNQIYDVIIDEKISIKKRLDITTSAISSYLSISGASLQTDTKEYKTPKLNRFIPLELIKTIKEEIDSKDMLVINDFTLIKEYSSSLYQYCYDNKIRSFVIMKIYGCKHEYGYLTFFDNERKRIWQSENRVLFKYFANILGLILDNIK